MTESSVHAVAAAVPAPGAAAAPLPGDGAATDLLARAIAHVLPLVTHDLRNGVGVVGVQLEALELRALAAVPDHEAIRRHGAGAASGIELVAAQLDALSAFARSDAGDLATIVAEAVALVPLRRLAIGAADAGATCLAPALLRAAVLELLVAAATVAASLTISVTRRDDVLELAITGDRPLGYPLAAEWLVHLDRAGARVHLRDDALVLSCPPA
ncbi:MAG: hypothetical protein MUF21_05490 [Gemmatimonadaceae bacterium]|nr:hypothetical protein [Gemmatimonadaceae bacterium]